MLNRINMGEGSTLATLFDALHEHDTADHIIREVWEGESEGDRGPLPWANGHGSRRTWVEYRERADASPKTRETRDSGSPPGTPGRTSST